MFRDKDSSVFKVLEDNDDDGTSVKQFLKGVNILCMIKMSAPFV